VFMLSTLLALNIVVEIDIRLDSGLTDPEDAGGSALPSTP
jgi:hypothetical protein